MVSAGSGETSGSAFCVDLSGLFITNAHVVRRAGTEAHVNLVLRPGEQEQRVFEATVYRRDESLDLAMLKVEPGLTALALGRDEDLFETMTTTTFGYPLGTILAFQRDGYPNISVNVHRISSLRKNQGDLALLQIDGQLNPGNSGGPLLDADGKVIGVAQAAIPNRGINFAIPVGQLTRFLAAPGLIFEPTPLTSEDRTRRTPWTVRVVPATPAAMLPADLHVCVTVTVPGRKPQTLEARATDPGVYQVQLGPLLDDLKGPVFAGEVKAVAEAKRGGQVLATVKRQTQLTGLAKTPPTTHTRGVVVTQGMPGLADEAFLNVGGPLNVGGAPLGAGRSIRPPTVAIGAAQVGSRPEPAGEIRRFVGHGNVLWNVAVSRDGRRLLTASHDYTVRLWDVETGRQLRVLSGHTDHVKGVAFLPDGRRGISGADDDTVRLWDVETGRQIRLFSGHTADVCNVVVSTDGQRALNCAMDRTARLWDVETGRELCRFVGHTGTVMDAAFLPDGHRALTSSSDGTVRLWELETGQELRRFGPVSGEVRLAVATDGRLALVGGGDGSVRLLDVETWQEVGRLAKHDEPISSLAFTPDGRRALTAWWGKDPDPVSDIAVLPDGRSVALAVHDGTARLYSLPGPEERGDTPAGEPLVRTLGGKIDDVAVGGGGRYLVLTLKSSFEVAVFDVNAADVVKRIHLASRNVLAAAGAKTLVLAFPDERTFQRWNLEPMSREGEIFPSPIRARLRGLTMGSDSDGPLPAAWTPDPAEMFNIFTHLSFIDTKTFQVLKAGPMTHKGIGLFGFLSSSGGSVHLSGFDPDRTHVRASAGGDLYGYWLRHSSGMGFQTITVHKAALEGAYSQEGIGHLAPGPDGLTVYTGRSGVFNAQGKLLRAADAPPPTNPDLTIPTPDPAYYLSVAGANVFTGTVREVPKVTASIHSAYDGTRLFSILGLDEMNRWNDFNTEPVDNFTIEKRFHFVPAANLLITIPYTNDRLILRRLDLRMTLERLDQNSLFVTSSPRLYGTTGEPLSHQIETFSKAGGVRYKLAQGPDGLTVSPGGKLTWPSPKPPADGDPVTAIVTISDSSGQERFQSLRISVD
jgi:WD40 repeat protein